MATTLDASSNMDCAKEATAHPELDALFRLSLQMSGLESAPPELLRDLVLKMRYAADLIERSPGSVKGLVFICGEAAADDAGGQTLHTHCEMVGGPALLAASKLILDPVAMESAEDLVNIEMGRLIEEFLAKGLK